MSNPPTLDNKKEAQKCKDLGNDYFRKNEYERAIEYYTKAIELEDNAIFYSNRALCHIRLENYGLAMRDSNKCIELHPTFIKGYYRRGMSKVLLLQYKDALQDFKQILKINPKEKMAKKRIKQCIAEIKRVQFEKAISTDQGEPVSSTIKLDEMFVPNNFKGKKIVGSLKDFQLNKEIVMDYFNLFKDQLKIPKKYVAMILIRMIEIFKEMPSLYDINVTDSSKITVCGDTHGQFYDTAKLFEINGFPSKDNPYLFNGDFVDRGSFSFENVMTLFLFKLLDSDCIHFTRGNHETRQLNRVYGFENEVKKKYGEQIYELFQEVFNWIPLCALINKKVFVMHGGVGFENDGVKLEDIKKIERNGEIPNEGLMCHLLWSDPQKNFGRIKSKRGVSWEFGPDVTKNFMENNKIDLIIRSHELKQRGYEVECGGKLITVFSAPNYCDQAKNLGAYIILRGNNIALPDIKTFKASPHPQVGSYVQYSI